MCIELKKKVSRGRNEMKLVLLLLLTISTLLVLRGKCAKILGVFPAPGYSQFILAEALMKELANRGHLVTVISPYDPKNYIHNYRTIKTDDVIGSGKGINLFDLESADLFTNILTTYQFGNTLTEVTLKNKNVQELLHSNETFDLVIVEQFFNEAMKAFATHFNAPLVSFCSQGATEWNKNFLGIPALPAISSVTYTSHTNTMNFFQRLKNLLGAVFDYYYKNYVAYPKQEEFVKKYFSKSMHFEKVIYNVSLILLNSHVTTTENELLPYNAIEIGGFHITEEPLNKELQNFLDTAEDGAILFSLGSNLRSSDLSEKTQEAIFKVFRRLKQKILWKFEEQILDKPSNVWITKWLNQSDILAHPNIQLFITHGGLLSTTEAIFYGVPMVGIPFFADQKMNIARAYQNGIATVIPFRNLSEESLATAINEVISNAKYRENARRLSNLMRDRIVRPLDLAMYWIEYVIRHKGHRFETATQNLTWYQIYLLDIFVFITFSLLTIFGLLRYCFYILLQNFCIKGIQKVGSNKKNKQKKY